MMRLTLILAVAAGLVLCLARPVVPGAGTAQSQCAGCHSDLKRLIRLCWEVEKIRPKAGPSAENAGEG